MLRTGVSVESALLVLPIEGRPRWGCRKLRGAIGHVGPGADVHHLEVVIDDAVGANDMWGDGEDVLTALPIAGFLAEQILQDGNLG